MIEGLTWDEARGQCSFHGKLLEFVTKLDLEFASWGTAFHAKSFQFPSFIAASDLQRLDYLKSFPHLATFALNLDEEESNLKEFTSSKILNEQSEIQMKKASPVKNVLTPAACYHLFIHHKNRVLDEPQHFTTRCTCYRREAYYKPLQRQWNFSMREIVCIGSNSDAEEMVHSLTNRINSFCEKVGLPTSWEGATDPFFNPSENPKYVMQKLDPVKKELLFGDGLAIASTNFHRNYFGDAFEIEFDQKEAFSACVAFGLERWIFAFYKKFGPDVGSWPEL